VRALLGLAVGLALGLAAAQAEAKPRRIASLNLCADQLVLELVEPERIASVSWLSRDATHSAMAEAARRVPVNYGRAEEIIPQNPDLVLVGRLTAMGATAALRRIGARVEVVGQPRDIAAIRDEIRAAGRLFGEDARAEAVVARLDARLAALSPPIEPRPSAALLRPNGVTAGPGSLVDSLLGVAGFANFAANHGLDRMGRLPLELLIAGRPDILVIDERDFGAPSLAQAYQALPAVRRTTPRRVVIPSWAWTCAGSAIAEAAERLAAARS
jgi:iron complex transport system substrate-binding protein